MLTESDSAEPSRPDIGLLSPPALLAAALVVAFIVIAGCALLIGGGSRDRQQTGYEIARERSVQQVQHYAEQASSEASLKGATRGQVARWLTREEPTLTVLFADRPAQVLASRVPTNSFNVLWLFPGPGGTFSLAKPAGLKDTRGRVHVMSVEFTPGGGKQHPVGYANGKPLYEQAPVKDTAVPAGN